MLHEAMINSIEGATTNVHIPDAGSREKFEDG